MKGMIDEILFFILFERTRWTIKILIFIEWSNLPRIFILKQNIFVFTGIWNLWGHGRQRIFQEIVKNELFCIFFFLVLFFCECQNRTFEKILSFLFDIGLFLFFSVGNWNITELSNKKSQNLATKFEYLLEQTTLCVVTFQVFVLDNKSKKYIKACCPFVFW